MPGCCLILRQAGVARTMAKGSQVKKTVLAAVLAPCVAAAAVPDTTVTPGLWEVRVTRQILDGQDVTTLLPVALAGVQQLMANATPQQRQQIEATLGKQPGSGGVQRMCVSPAMAAGDKPLLPADVRCQPTAFERNGERVNFQFNCSEPGRTVTGKGESLLASRVVTTRVDLVVTDARGRHTLQNDSQASFVGADCGNLKPADQVVHDSGVTRQKAP